MIRGRERLHRLEEQPGIGNWQTASGWNLTMIGILAALEAFDASVTLGEYNLWNAHVACATPAEEELATTLNQVNLLTPSEWQAIRARVDKRLAGKLLTFAFRMASRALQAKNEGLIYSGVVAIILDNDLLDPRDIYMVSSVLFDAGERIGVPPDGSFRRATQFATERRRNVIVKGFLSGPPYMKAIKSMGMYLVEEGSLAYYQHKPF
jgi:hypothetical protein